MKKMMETMETVELMEIMNPKGHGYTMTPNVRCRIIWERNEMQMADRLACMKNKMTNDMADRPFSCPFC